MANYSFKTGTDLPQIPIDKTFRDTNFAQIVPYTNIFENITGLIFIDCNLVNCQIPNDAITQGCLNIQKSRCSHLWSSLIDLGLSVCAAECQHMVSKEEVTIDGVLLETVYQYEDILL